MTYKNVKIILISFGVPILFSLLLWMVALTSISPLFLNQNERFTYGVVGSLSALAVIFMFLKVDKKTWGNYHLKVEKRTPIRFLKGAVIGVVLCTALFLLQAWYSGLEISLAKVDLGQFALMSLSLIPLAFMEELAFRSYPFFKLNESYGVWTAQITMSILFALYHYIGGWSLMASFIGPGIWSFAFGLMALKSKGIALPTGFHFGLNLSLAAIGNKYWIPTIWTIDFAGSPTDEMLKSNEYFGVAIQLLVFIALVAFTYIYRRKTHGKTQSN
ncbi:lysostaphin resistance A-like protein [Ekhidna sp.]